jgi:hypothetical protein
VDATVPPVSLVWSVPVVAAAVAAGLVLARVRALEEAAFGLWREVARLSEVRRPLAGLREATRETDALAAAFRARHAPDAGAPEDPEPAG